MPSEDLKKLKESSQDERSLTNPNGSTGRKGIPIEALISYRKRGLTLQEIGDLTGISKQSVSERLQSIDFDGLAQFRDGKDDVLEYHQRRVVNNLTDDDIKKMSGLQKLIGIKLTDEAIRTIRGQATEIIDHRIMVVDLNKAIEQLRQEQGLDAITVELGESIEVSECPKV